MAKAMKWGAIAVLIVLLLFAGWLFRPWAEYSPARLIIDREFTERTQTFRNMDEVLPFQPIAGAATPYEFPRNERDVLSLTYEWEGQTHTIADFIERGFVTGLVVLHEGVLVHESYHHGETREDRHTSWSVAKSYVAALIGIAMKDGLITSLDDRTDKYAPEFAGTDYGEITLRQLLMMSSGIDFNEDYEARGSDIRVLFFDTFLLNRDVDHMVRRHVRNRPPESDFDYISSNTHVLAAVVRNAYGKPLGDIVSEKLFKPLGMADASWSKDRNSEDGKAIGYCCLNTRALDYAKFGQLHLQDGVWNGTRILPEGWVDLIRTPPSEHHEPGPLGTHRGYGLHFWLPSGADDEFSANGYNGQIIWMDKKRDVVIMRTGADADFVARSLENEVVMRTIAEAVAQP